jgi:succinate dehydrogenase/fumarate reductase iron-sulfur protein
LKAKFHISRQSKGKSWIVEFDVDLREAETVLDVLKRLKDEVDGSLSFRHSCRSGICGSCAVQVNGSGKLACKTQVNSELDKFGEVRLEPLRGARVLNDLVVDFEGFFDALHRLETWIEPLDENIKISADEIKPVDEAAGCILCGICTFNCETFIVEREFAGPAALAQSYKIIADPKGGNKRSRLAKANKNGLWWCSRSYYCSDLCPRGVKPAEKIFNLRSMCLERGLKKGGGAKRIIEFKKSLEGHGRLNETLLPLRVKGYGAFSLLPIGIRLLLKRRLPSPRLKDIDGLEDVRRILMRKKL